MEEAGWILLLAALLSLTSTEAHNHSVEAETYQVSAGRLFLLRCLFADSDTNVTWSRTGWTNQSLPSGVEVRDRLLWFVPVQMSHHGSYTCEKRCEKGSSRMSFGVSVSSGACPDPPETVSITQGVSGGLPCKQKEIFDLKNRRSIRWMKDCRSVERKGGISVHESGYLRLPEASESDAGIYTCLVNVSLNGRTYTAARSIQLTIDNDTIMPEPLLLRPDQDVVVVEEGRREELECYAYIGYSEDEETEMYWTVNGSHTDDHKELNDSWKFVHEGRRVFGQSILSISNVHRRFLNVPFSCHVSNSVGAKIGSVWLREADHSALYTTVALCLTASLALLALAAAFLLFKVDLVLAHRTLMRHVSKQKAPDGKLYDAYVSFLHPDSRSSAEAASFALQILPEKLERKHGFSLFIRGRDDLPGQAVHDVIAASMSQCRRLIIILSPEIKSSCDGEREDAPLHANKTQLWYEHKVGIYDALTQNDSQVILVEVDGPVDYSCLPESLRYIKRKQGALKWSKPSPRTHKLSKMQSNRNFWKNLRYHMPSVPAGTQRAVV